MFSPVKAITAGAIVAALGGVMLISQPFEQRGSVPAAEGEAIAPTWVTGNIQPVDGSCDRGTVTSDAGVSRSSYECTATWTSSDPRLTGDAWGPWIEDAYQTDEGAISVGTEAHYLQNEGGGWACSSAYVIKGVTPTVPTTDNTLTCHGSGGYEGLTAVLIATPTGEFALEFSGLIFSGDLPPVPEAPAAE